MTGQPTKAELVTLLREFLLCGHLIDRSGMPQLIARFGRDVMTEVAIDEWAGASPIYSPRMRRALGCEGRDDVETLFKTMQFDIGAPPGFMDFRYQVTDAHHGEFHLAHCGALLDVEPMGEEYVVAMCHHIEDPTFDATAGAINPRARVRPIHRPPRSPADRHPHCHWRVDIDPDREPLPTPAVAARVAATAAATWPMRDLEPSGDGEDDERGPLDPDLDLTRFSTGLLARLLDEVALQWHLLVMSGLAAVADRAGRAAANEIGVAQATGIAGLTAERLRRAFDLDSSCDSLAWVLDHHPMFRPDGYVQLEVAHDGDELVVSLVDCPAVHEELPGWAALLAAGATEPMEAIGHGVDPTFGCRSEGPGRWRYHRLAEPVPERPEVTLTRFSGGATFAYSPVTVG